MLIQRRDKDKTLGGDAAIASDITLQTLAPALYEWLTVTKWGDGKKRETGTIMLLAEGGLWKAWVHDRESRSSCWLAGASLEELLARVERTLLEGGGEWRPDKR